MHIDTSIDSVRNSRATHAVLTLVAGVAAAAFSVGCGNRPDTVAPLVASAIAITAPDGAVPVTGTMQFVATVTDADGHTLATTPTWTVANGGGMITSGGLFTAGDSTGTFVNTIVATIGSVHAMCSITVSAGGLATISIVPADDTIAVDATKQLAAHGTDEFGNAVELPAGLVWAVSSPTAGTVDSTGHFSAGSVVGSYSISATSGSVVGHGSIHIAAGPLASILVSPAADSVEQHAYLQFTAVGTDAHDNVVEITPVWSATSASGEIDGDGLFLSSVGGGTYTDAITATSGLITGHATVTLNPGPVAFVTVTPARASVHASGTVQFVASGTDDNGNRVRSAAVWSLRLPALGTISSTGLLTVSSTASGSYPASVIATVDTASTYVSVTVTSGP